ncbi:MAG TPA: pantoate--beta-alanine ligase, partial [Gammaproteobacteria bacterium]|nr:pantoate--beta-alanine ligase [Gammaproteobacteria bacterium]
QAERALAPGLYRTLQGLARRLAQGERDLPGLERAGWETLGGAGFRPEYVAVRRAGDLEQPGPGDRDLVALASAWLGRARLIDNIRVSVG